MINDFDAVTNQIRDDILEWLKKYQLDSKLTERRAESGGVLSGEALEDFIGTLQDKIVESVTKYAGGFGENTVGDNATLILYSGVNPQMVEKFCSQSGGKYYMISQTGAGILWNEDVREKIAETIGEDKPTEPISARVLEGKEGKYDLKKGDLRFRLENDAKYATDSHKFLALDDFISLQVVEAGIKKGKIRYVLENSHSGIPRSVGMLSEIPRVMNEVWRNPDKAADTLELNTDFRIDENGAFSLTTKTLDEAQVYVSEDDKVVYVDLRQCVDKNAVSLDPPVTYHEALTYQAFLERAQERQVATTQSDVVLHVAQPEPLTPENSYYKIVSEQELSALQKEKGLYHEARRTPNGEIIVRCHKNDKERMLSVIESAAKHLKL